MPDQSFRKEISPNIQSEPPLTQLEAIASRPIAGYLGEETNTHLTTPSFQVVVGSEKVKRPGAWPDRVEEMPDLLQIPAFASSTHFAQTRTVAQLFLLGLTLNRQPNTGYVR